MNRTYRGFELEAKRDEGSEVWGGEVWGSAVRVSDGWVLYDGMGVKASLRGALRDLEWQVDRYLAHPEWYKGGE